MPLVGNVAMDAVMADVTDVPGAPVTIDDEFVLVGSQGRERIPIEELARLRTTNTWESVTAMSRRLPRVYHAAAVPVAVRTIATWRDSLTRIQLWNGDICELEVDAIVSPANPSLWMSTGVGQALKARAGDEVEFAAVRQLPVSVGDAVVTSAGRLAARLLIHAVSLDRDRRTSGEAIEAAVRSAFARAREHDVISPWPCRRSGPGSAATRWTMRPGSPSRPSATSSVARPTSDR